MTVALTLVLFIEIGFAVALFLPSSIPRYLPGRLGAIFLLGAGSCGAALFALGALGVPLGLTAFAAVPAAALLVIVMRWKAAGRLVARTRLRGDGHEALTTAVVLLPYAVLLLTTAVLPLSDYDGRTSWMPKAQAIAREESIDGPFFQGARGLNLHNRYPLLVPLDAAALIRLSADPEAYRALFVLVVPALLLAMRDLLAARRGRAAAAWCVAALAWLPQLAGGLEGSAATAYADLPLAAFFGMAVATLAARGRRGAGAAALWSAFAILTKNEGLVLAFATIAAAAATWPGRRAIPRMVLAPLAAALLLFLWQQGVPDAYDERNTALVRSLPRNAGRIDDAARALARHAIEPGTWGLLWPMAGVALVVAGARKRSRIAVVPAIALGVMVSGYVLVLACTSWSIDDLARVASNRLLAHGLVPAALLLVAGARRTW